MTRAQVSIQTADFDLSAEIAALRREEANSQLRDLDSRVLELVERRHVLGDRIAGLDLRAPVSGRVLGLQLNRGIIAPADFQNKPAAGAVDFVIEVLLAAQ